MTSYSMGIVFALLTTFSWAICIFPFTAAARKLGSNSLNHFRLFLATIVLCLVLIIYNANEFSALFSASYLNAWLWLSISGIVGLTIGDYFAFVMYSILGARIGSVLTTFAPAAALILGSLVVDEHISAIGIVGIFITIAGVNFLSFGKRERIKMPDLGHGSVIFGMIAGILAALCQGAGLVLAKKGLMAQSEHEMLSPLSAAFMRVAAATTSLFLFSLISGNILRILRPVLRNEGGGIKQAIAGTIFGPVLGVCLSLYSVSLIDPSVSQTIFSLVPVFALILSAIYFKEKISKQAIAGLTVAICGVVILIWRAKIIELF